MDNVSGLAESDGEGMWVMNVNLVSDGGEAKQRETKRRAAQRAVFE